MFDASIQDDNWVKIACFVDDHPHSMSFHFKAVHHIKLLMDHTIAQLTTFLFRNSSNYHLLIYAKKRHDNLTVLWVSSVRLTNLILILMHSFNLFSALSVSILYGIRCMYFFMQKKKMATTESTTQIINKKKKTWQKWRSLWR